MTKLLQNADCKGIFDQLFPSLTTNNGVLLLIDAKDILLPRISLQILDVLTNLGTCHQEDGETVEKFGAWIEHIFSRIKSFNYTTFDQLKVAYTLWGFLHSVYMNHESLSYIQQKL